MHPALIPPAAATVSGFPLKVLFVLIPLAIGVLIPARPLDSTALSTRGFTTSSALVTSGSSSTTFESNAEQRTILDWIKIFNYETDLDPYIGQQAAVVGFVYHDGKLPVDQFYGSRFVVSCCSADGFALAMVTEWPGAATDTATGPHSKALARRIRLPHPPVVPRADLR